MKIALHKFLNAHGKSLYFLRQLEKFSLSIAYSEN